MVALVTCCGNPVSIRAGGHAARGAVDFGLRAEVQTCGCRSHAHTSHACPRGPSACPHAAAEQHSSRCLATLTVTLRPPPGALDSLNFSPSGLSTSICGGVHHKGILVSQMTSEQDRMHPSLYSCAHKDHARTVISLPAARGATAWRWHRARADSFLGVGRLGPKKVHLACTRISQFQS